MSESNVIKFPTAVDSPAKLLECVNPDDLESCVVLGMGKDGHVKFASSTDDVGALFFMLEAAKQHVLQCSMYGE